MSISLEYAQKRERAYTAIGNELHYQEARAKRDNWDHKNVPSVEGEILMIEEYVAKARAAYTNNAGNEQALHELRKVAAMCVRAMINHGAYEREGFI